MSGNNEYRKETNADIIEKTYYEYHGERPEGSEEGLRYGFHVVEEESEATAV